MTVFSAWFRKQDGSPLTVRVPTVGLYDFATWFAERTGKVLAPARVTPLDITAYRQHFIEARRRGQGEDRPALRVAGSAVVGMAVRQHPKICSPANPVNPASPVQARARKGEAYLPTWLVVVQAPRTRMDWP